MDQRQYNYFSSCRIEELQRLIDTILGYPKDRVTKQDVAVLKDARELYLKRMGEKYR